MKPLPEKIHNALSSVDMSLLTLLSSIDLKNVEPYGAFIAYDTLFTYQGALNRALGKSTYSELVLCIRKALEAYALRSDKVGMTNPRTQRKTKEVIISARSYIRNLNSRRNEA